MAQSDAFGDLGWFFWGGDAVPPLSAHRDGLPCLQCELGGETVREGGVVPILPLHLPVPQSLVLGGEEKRVISTWLGGAGTPPSNIITSGRRDSKPSPHICGGDPPKYHPPLHPPNITTPLDTPSTPPKTRHSMPSPQSSEAV